MLPTLLCFGFGEDAPIVDSNIRRIYQRMFYSLDVSQMTDSEVYSFAEKLLPEDEAQPFN